MESSRIIDVLVICLPVFAVMGLGKLLGIRGRLTAAHCDFINWLVCTFSLPALIFYAVARQTFRSFLDPAVIVIPLVALLIVSMATMGVAWLFRLRGAFAAAFVFGTFWANATYIGIPLCINAFGQSGEAKSAVYNAFVVPFFILFGFLLIGFYGDGQGDSRLGDRVKKAFLNPILLSAVAGVLIALVTDQFRDGEGIVHLPKGVTALAMLAGSFLRLIGAMGLPLALLSIGATLKWENCRNRTAALAWTIICKLIVLPLVTLCLIRWWLPSADPASLGVAVILSGTPLSVASYVISCQQGIERTFVAAMLVISTGCSMVTIPMWIYVVKGLC